MDRRIVGARQRIDNLEATAKSVTGDAELQAQLARFLCVLASGLIEIALTVTLENHAKKCSHPRIAKYVGAQLSGIHNAKFKKITSTLGRFDAAWQTHFEKTSDPQVKDAIDSIVNNRNQISHGGQTNISLITFSQYYKSLKSFIVDLDTFIGTQ